MKAFVIGALVLVGGVFSAQAANAGTLTCSGSHLGYQFGLTATTQGQRVVGNVIVNVAQNGRSVKRANLQPTSSSIQAGRSVQLNAQGADGSGSLQATYNGGSYSGTLVAGTQYGTFNVSVGCSLSGANFSAEELESSAVYY